MNIDEYHDVNLEIQVHGRPIINMNIVMLLIRLGLQSGGITEIPKPGVTVKTILYTGDNRLSGCFIMPDLDKENDEELDEND